LADDLVKVIAAKGAVRRAETPRPVVVAVAEGANSPRYANAARVINSYQKWNPETWNAADLSLAESDLEVAVERRGQAFPPERQPGTVLSGATSW